MQHRFFKSAVLLLGLMSTGCYINTQRFPAPMPGSIEDLPKGASEIFKAGPEEVLLMRISDPVYLRRPGENSSYPMHFHNKRTYISPGYWVLCEAGGRAELVFITRGSEMSLSGNNTVVLGSPSRGEPLVSFLEVDNATLSLSSNDYVELVGGALLSGEGGPFVLSHPTEEVLVLSNRSQAPAVVRYLDEILDLAPGETVHLPLLAAGASPREPSIGFKSLEAAGSRWSLRGTASVVGQGKHHLDIIADADHEIRGQGIRVRLDKGERVEFDDLSPKKAE
ncbi:MAG: hypothetical protein JKY61_03955 [Planctomycetes bacterium]|nr:hypothetical protein [Planctomycetota bacterium]